jgi:protein gp37
MRTARRFAGPGGWAEGLVSLKTGKWTGETRLAVHKLKEPLTWREPSTVFVDSMSDLFYEEFEDDQIAAVFAIMAACPQHTFIILTKRPERMRMWFRWVDSIPDPPGHGHGMTHPIGVCANAAAALGIPVSVSRLYEQRGGGSAPWPLPNVWLGTSVENQDEIHRVTELAGTPAALRLLSCEPLLGHLELGLMGTLPSSVTGTAYVMTHERIRWVIAGAESGPGARPCSIDDLCSLRDQCAEADVKFFLKQAVACCRGVGPMPGHIHAGAESEMKPGGLVIDPYLDGKLERAFPEVQEAA